MSEVWILLAFSVFSGLTQSSKGVRVMTRPSCWMEMEVKTHSASSDPRVEDGLAIPVGMSGLPSSH